ncbi:MAG: thioesterase family protein [Akkermansiaceae bacterium]|jgi:acyl-CoA thioesterase FadM|nr:thioesterase family protein [Akkermansiaceae bacterium]
MENPAYRHAGVIAFGDTDASGWVHFPNIFKYVEAAEHAFLRSRGVIVFDRLEGGWPRVKVSCDFTRPLQCGESIETQLVISRIGTTSITWDFEISHATGETAALGSMTTVRVDTHGRPQEISAAERAALR